MEDKSLTDLEGKPTVTADPKQPWEKPAFKEADIAGITQSVGLGQNDGGASHT